MHQAKPLSEVAPMCRLMMDEPPPIGTDIWLITMYGTGYRGRYNAMDKSVVAWCPLPKLTDDQKQRLKDAGVML